MGVRSWDSVPVYRGYARMSVRRLRGELVNETVVHTKRLRKLARILEKHKNARSKSKGTKFNMEVWGLHDASHKPTLKEGFCGTTACALGHAAMDKEFAKAGLALQWEPSSFFDGFLEAEVVFNDNIGEWAGAE